HFLIMVPDSLPRGRAIPTKARKAAGESPPPSKILTGPSIAPAPGLRAPSVLSVYRRPPPTKEMLSMWPFSSRKTLPLTSDRPRRSPYRPRLEALEDRRLLSAGALDPTFGSGGVVTTALNKYNDTAYGVLLQPNGYLIAYGDAQTSLDQFGLARYTPAGKL